MRLRALNTLFILSLTACSAHKAPTSVVQANAVSTVPTAPVITEPVPDKADVTYMARYMLPGPQQSAAAIYGSLGSASTPGSGSNIATGAAVAGALGQSPASRAGVGTASYTGAALGILGGLAATRGRDEVIGRYYLPGTSILTAQQARDTAKEDIQKRVESFGLSAGYDVICLERCESYFPTYRFYKSATHREWRYYDPQTLFLTVFIYKPTDQRKRTNAVLDRILGFENAWEGAFFIALANEQPAQSMRTVDGEEVPDYQDESAFSHPLERSLLRALTAGTNYALGSLGWRQFGWGGRVFLLGEPPDVEHLISAQISVETDRP